MFVPSRTAAWGTAVFTFALLGFACSSSSSPSQPSTTADDCPSTPVSFKTDVIPTFAHNCTDSVICHGQPNDGLAENLYLGLAESAGTNDADGIAMIHAGLVGVKAVENPAMNLVSTGDLESSFLWHKLQGDQNSDATVSQGCQAQATGPMPCSDCLPEAPCGVPMPLGTAVDPAATCVLRNWILQGAKSD